MAVRRSGALAVAVGVPVAFALVAAVLALGSPTQAASDATDAAVPAAVVSSSPGASGPLSVTRSAVQVISPNLPVLYRVPTKDPVVFITIDDGVTKDRAGLRFVEERELPVTAFLTAWTIQDDAEYFRRITRWGGIANHSATHDSFANSSTNLNHEICYTQRMLKRTFGSRPWLMRPPYGAGSTRLEMQLVADRCGIYDIVMWNAVVERGRLTRAGGELQPGDIVLLHFTPNLEKDLRTAVRAARKAGLTVANLADYLTEGSGGRP